jgi:hypothetical protein
MAADQLYLVIIADPEALVSPSDAIKHVLTLLVDTHWADDPSHQLIVHQQTLERLLKLQED